MVRIREMEHSLNETEAALRRLNAALDAYEQVQPSVALLSAYLGSEEWRQDLAADEKGLLPTDLHRGVLSEDGIWNLLEENRDLALRMAAMANTVLKNK